jgi:dihydropyrimidine dehydrogenase (NAD+) subunit PreT
VVGAGPAGLSCAHRLAMLGHDVVVFEARDKAGGLNEYGIAKYKLPGDFAQREVEFLLSIGGIEIQHGMTLGSTCSWPTCTRATTPCSSASACSASRRLGLTGEDAPGLMAAVDYIATLRQAGDLAALPVPRRAIVIGAGNTAIDMAVQLKRLGADEVTLVYRRGFDAMSATGHEIEIAKTNFVRIRTWAAPLEVLLDDAGRVRGMRFEETRLEDGRLLAHRRLHRDRGRRRVQGHRPGMDGTALLDPLARRARTHVRRQDPGRRRLPHRAAGRVCRRRLRGAGAGPDGAGGPARQAGRAGHPQRHPIQAEAAWPT